VRARAAAAEEAGAGGGGGGARAAAAPDGAPAAAAADAQPQPSIDESQFGAAPWAGDPGADPISDEILLQIVRSAIPDAEVNRLVWEALG